MAWFYLVIAGLLETAWATGLKSVAGSFNIGILVLTTVLMFGSLGALGIAMRTLPLGVAYPIWTGIGSVGAVAVSVVVFRQDIGLPTIAGVVLLIGGMYLISLDNG